MTAKVRRLSQTAEIRKVKGPAFTPNEIGSRLATIANRLERRLELDEMLNAKDLRLLAHKLRVYSRRLQGVDESSPASSADIY